MVTILPKENDWSEAGQLFGSGLTQGYQNRADEMALQKAISGLGDNPTPRQILDAVTNTKTSNPAAKQNLFKNYLGAAEFEEVKRHAKASEEVNGLKNTLSETQAKAKQQADMNDALTLIDSAKIPHEEKEVLREKAKKGEASFNAIKEVLKPNKEDIKNKEEEKTQNITQKAFNDIAELIPDVGVSGIVTSKFGGDTAKAYSKFTSLTGALEALLVEKVNRGALSNTRFKYITETLLPKPSDSQADIRGKLEGLATILELDPSVLTGKEKNNDSKNNEVNIYKLPPPSEYKGEDVEASDGTTYYSDGEKWMKR